MLALSLARLTIFQFAAGLDETNETQLTLSDGPSVSLLYDSGSSEPAKKFHLGIHAMFILPTPVAMQIPQ